MPFLDSTLTGSLCRKNAELSQDDLIWPLGSFFPTLRGEVELVIQAHTLSLRSQGERLLFFRQNTIIILQAALGFAR